MRRPPFLDAEADLLLLVPEAAVLVPFVSTHPVTIEGEELEEGETGT